MLKHFVREGDFAAIVSSICINKNDIDLKVKNLSKFFPKMNYSIAKKSVKALSPVAQTIFGLMIKTT